MTLRIMGNPVSAVSSLGSDAKFISAPVNKIHNYNTGLASKSSYALTKTRTNYGLFNLRHQGAKL